MLGESLTLVQAWMLSCADLCCNAGLSIDMCLVFRKASRGMSTTNVTVDFNVTFGGRMESFISHKDRISELMWTWQLENSAEISGTWTSDVGFDSLA